jgi:hypothetical protein
VAGVECGIRIEVVGDVGWYPGLGSLGGAWVRCPRREITVTVAPSCRLGLAATTGAALALEQAARFQATETRPATPNRGCNRHMHQTCDSSPE